MSRSQLLCECPEASPKCCNGQHSAVYRVMRKGKILHVCTRCDFSDDEEKQLLENFTMEELADNDPLGFFVIALELAERR